MGETVGFLLVVRDDHDGNRSVWIRHLIGEIAAWGTRENQRTPLESEGAGYHTLLRDQRPSKPGSNGHPGSRVTCNDPAVEIDPCDGSSAA